MKKTLIFIIFSVFIVIAIFFIKIKKNFSTASYLWYPKTTNIYSERNNITDITLPFNGKISGALFVKGEKAGLEINGKKLEFDGKFLLFFPKEKDINIRLLEGKAYLFNSPEFKLKNRYLKENLRFKNKVFLRLLYEIKPDFFKVKEIFTSSFNIPKKTKVILQNILTDESWIKEHNFLKKYSYIKVNKTAYQAKYILPDSEIVVKKRIYPKMRLSFYAGSINSLSGKDYFDKIGDGTIFSIFILRKGKRKKIFEKKIVNSVELFNIKITQKGDALLFKTSRGENAIGDICFWGTPYLYRPSKKKRVFILISLDTVRAKSLSLYNKEKRTTPFLKKWANSETTYFTKAYTTHPWTTAAHRSVFFSTYSWEGRKLSLAEFLQKKGFYTIAITGGNLVSSVLGFSRGFVKYLDNNSNLFNREAGKVLFENAKKSLKFNNDKNIFIFLHTYQAHSPYIPPYRYSILGAKGIIDMSALTNGVKGTFSPLPEKIRKKAEKLYEEEILTIDQDFLKPLINYLKKTGLYSKTSILIFGDHGEQFYEHGSWEHGYSLYDEEVRVPLIFKSLSKHRKGKNEELISLKEIPILISKELGFKPFKGWKTKEKNFIVFATSQEYSLLSFPFKIGIIKGDYKLIYNVKLDKRKFKDPPSLPRYEMYNLKNDPEERENIVFKNKRIFKELRRILNIYYKKAASQRRKNLEKIKKNLKSLGYVD